MLNENEGLKREIGLWGLISNSINIIIGAGIFILPVIVAERLGMGSIWAYLICGLLMIFIMLCFAELGTMITRTGGAYSYIETAFGRYAGFLTTNIFIFGAAIMANAAVANGLADTLAYFIPILKLQWIRIVFFAVIFGGLAYINVKGVRNAITVVKLNTIVKLIPLLMIGLLGWFFIEKSDIIFTTENASKDLGEISLILLFAFVGAETALNVSGEIKKPEKTIPLGIMLSIVIVVVLYILIQVTVQGILGSSITDFRNAPLVEVGKRMFGIVGASVVLIGASFSMFGNISGMVLNMPRVLFAAARDKVLQPQSLASVHHVYKTPHVSIIVYALMGFIFAAAGEFKQLAMLSSASYLLIYLGVVLAMIRFRLVETSKNANYRVPGGYIIPVISIITIIWVLSNLPIKELTAMALFILILTIIYFGLKYSFKKISDGKLL
jgi:basic amino acid/polyamine antiporter, APA family